MTLAIALSNAWFSYDDAYALLGQTDTFSYRAIAAAAPSLSDLAIPYHHLQRLWPSWIIGSLAKTVAVPGDDVFLIAAIACWVGAISVTAWLGRRLGLGWTAVALAVALIAFNPYLGRYWLAVPFMVNDALFFFGVAVAAAGVAVGGWRMAAVGLAIAALGRQTALPLALALWIGWLWAARPRGAISLTISTVWALGLYGVGGHIATAAGSTSINAEHLTAGFHWLKSDVPHKGYALSMFATRMMAAQISWLACAVALCLRVRPSVDARSATLALIAAAVWAQPMLAGPEANIARSTVIALPALVTLWMLTLARAREFVLANAWAVVALLFLFVASLHHQWSVLGQILLRTPMHFAALTYGASAVAGLASYFSLQRRGMA